MKNIFLSLPLGVLLFPSFAGAVTFDQNNYQMDQIIAIFGVSGNGGRLYNLTTPDFVVTVQGWSGEYELPVDFLIPGDYVVIDTNDPNVCGTLTLDECRVNPDYIGETTFSIKTKSGLLDTLSGFFLGLIGIGDTATSTDTVTTENTNTDSLANVISAVSDTATSTAPVIQDTAPVPTIDIIDSGAIPDTATSTPTPAPVIQENADGSTTLIAI